MSVTSLVRGVGEVPLVCEHEQHSIPELVPHQLPRELLSGLISLRSVTAVNHRDETVCSGDSGTTEANLVLAMHVPHSETMFLSSTVSTLKPLVGTVVTSPPSFSLHRMVVFSAPGRPTARTHISCLPKRPLRFAKVFPMLQTRGRDTGPRNPWQLGRCCCSQPGVGSTPTAAAESRGRNNNQMLESGCRLGAGAQGAEAGVAGRKQGFALTHLPNRRFLAEPVALWKVLLFPLLF